MTDRQVLISIVIISLITIALRALPFILLKGRKTPAWIEYMGRVLPFAVIGMLVVYCLKGISFTTPAGFAPVLIATAVVVLSYVWKQNTLLSIISGTVIYMILVQFVF